MSRSSSTGRFHKYSNSSGSRLVDILERQRFSSFAVDSVVSKDSRPVLKGHTGALAKKIYAKVQLEQEREKKEAHLGLHLHQLKTVEAVSDKIESGADKLLKKSYRHMQLIKKGKGIRLEAFHSVANLSQILLPRAVDSPRSRLGSPKSKMTHLSLNLRPGSPSKSIRKFRHITKPKSEDDEAATLATNYHGLLNSFLLSDLDLCALIWELVANLKRVRSLFGESSRLVYEAFNQHISKHNIIWLLLHNANFDLIPLSTNFEILAIFLKFAASQFKCNPNPPRPLFQNRFLLDIVGGDNRNGPKAAEDLMLKVEKVLQEHNFSISRLEGPRMFNFSPLTLKQFPANLERKSQQAQKFNTRLTIAPNFVLLKKKLQVNKFLTVLEIKDIFVFIESSRLIIEEVSATRRSKLFSILKSSKSNLVSVRETLNSSLLHQQPMSIVPIFEKMPVMIEDSPHEHSKMNAKEMLQLHASMVKIDDCYDIDTDLNARKNLLAKRKIG